MADILQALNEARLACHVGALQSTETPRRSHGSKREGVHIVGEKNLQRFDAALDSLLDGELGATVSRSVMEKKVVEFVRRTVGAGAPYDKPTADMFAADVLAAPVQQYRVLRSIEGITLEGGAPLALGPFVIYDWARDRDAIVSHLDDDNGWIFDRSEHGNLIEYVAAARDQERAREIADRAFHQFELLLRFTHGSPTYFDVAILTSRKPSVTHHVVVSEHSAGFGANYEGAVMRFKLNEASIAISPFFSRMIGVIARKASPWERKLVSSMEWTAQAMAERHHPTALIKAATALEILFGRQEKGPITASVMNSIAEGTAHVLGKTVEECVALEADVKHLYGRRSAAVHSGNDTASPRDARRLTRFARDALLAVSTAPEYVAIQSPEQFHEDLRARRYRWRG